MNIHDLIMLMSSLCRDITACILLLFAGKLLRIWRSNLVILTSCFEAISYYNKCNIFAVFCDTHTTHCSVDVGANITVCGLNIGRSLLALKPAYRRPSYALRSGRSSLETCRSTNVKISYRKSTYAPRCGMKHAKRWLRCWSRYSSNAFFIILDIFTCGY